MTKCGSETSIDSMPLSNFQQLWPLINLIKSGTRLANTIDELRKKQKDRNDQGNGGCVDRFGPSLFLRIRIKFTADNNPPQIEKAAGIGSPLRVSL